MVVRDSTGIEIVETAGQPGAVWRIVEPHRIEIGTVDGDAEYLLSGVRDVLRLSDGRIVVADSDSREVRYYDGEGVFQRSSGRRGSGPGEYEALSSIVRLRGDSLVVFDSRQRRVTILDSEGTYVRDWSIPALSDSEFPLEVVGVMGNGVPVGLQSSRSTPNQDGYRRDQWKLALIPGPSAGAAFLSDEYRGREMFEAVSPPPGGRMVMTSSSLPFGRTTHFVMTDSNIFVGSSDTYEIRMYGSEGSLVRIIRKTDVTPVPISDDGIEWYIDQQMKEYEGVEIGGIAPDLPAIRELMFTWPRVAGLPAFAGLLAGASGGLWVKRQEVPWTYEGREAWDVFDGDGVLQAQVENPSNLVIHEVGADYVLGVVTDELGVERVRLYDLDRSN